MKTTIKINSIFGKLLFEYKTDDNTIKKTLLEAIKENADLSNADLRNADLSNADLSNADLSNADLYNADLRNADLPMYCKHAVTLINDEIKIGCKVKTIEQWDLWFASDEVYETKRDTPEFLRIRAYYEGIKAYKLTLKP